MALKIEPSEATFVGPNDRPCRAQIKLSNETSKRVVMKVKVSDQLIRARPVFAFVNPGECVEVIFQTAPIVPKTVQTVRKRKAAICYALAVDDANDAYTYAKQLSKNNWKHIKLPLRYPNQQNVSPGPSSSQSSTTASTQTQ